jgi:hypothetical protein
LKRLMGSGSFPPQKSLTCPPKPRIPWGPRALRFRYNAPSPPREERVRALGVQGSVGGFWGRQSGTRGGCGPCIVPHGEGGQSTAIGPLERPFQGCTSGRGPALWPVRRFPWLCPTLPMDVAQGGPGHHISGLPEPTISSTNLPWHIPVCAVQHGPHVASSRCNSWPAELDNSRCIIASSHLFFCPRGAT